METSQRDELELVAHRAQFLLEFGDGGIIQILLPVERWRAVIRQHLAWELGMDGFGELLRESQIRLAGFTPDQIGIVGVSQTARDCLLNTRTGLEEAFNSTFAGQ